MKIERIILCSVILITAIFPTFSVYGYAAEKLTVNGESVSKGDTVTFTFYMSGVDDPIEAAGAYINFNPEFLEYIDGSIGFDVLENAMINAGDESIYYCAIDVVNGFDFKEERLVVTASFKVLDTAKGATVITNTFDEIFTFENEEEDLTPDDYISRTVISVNDTLENTTANSGIKAADVTETSDIAAAADTKKGVSAGLIMAEAAVFLACAVGTFFFLKKRKRE